MMLRSDGFVDSPLPLITPTAHQYDSESYKRAKTSPGLPEASFCVLEAKRLQPFLRVFWWWYD